jgi:hypothetical protein
MKNYLTLWQAAWGGGGHQKFPELLFVVYINATLNSKRHFLHKKLLGIMCNVIGALNAVTVCVK